MSIEERSKESMRYHLDESFKIFNKEHNSMREWQYGYCQGYFEAMQEFMLSSIFYTRVDKDAFEKAQPYFMKALSGSEEERMKAIEELKNIINN